MLDHPTLDKAHVMRSLETSINIGLVILLATSCFLILRPFILLIAWGIIIAVAAYPAFKKLSHLRGEHEVLAAALFTLILLAVLILPAVLLAQNLVEVVQAVTARLKEGTLIIPPPPPRVGNWPIIGRTLQSTWSLASSDISAALAKFAPEIKSLLPRLLSASAGVGLTVLQLVLSILVSGVLLANAEVTASATRTFFIRLFGERGPEFQQLVGSTIRNVTFGILGVALIQSACAAAGFLLAGVPGASVWIVVFLIAAMLQAGGLVLIPAVIYEFAVASPTKAIIFLVWCVFVGLMDNFLKPVLLGRGAVVPIAVVFVGAIGGFVAMGIVGLFVGAIVLSVGYKLFLAWLHMDADAERPPA
jgi:predicted PurR-regulated permease PerM